MYYQITLIYLTSSGRYEKAVCRPELSDFRRSASFLQEWMLTQLPECSQIVSVQQAWSPKPTSVMVVRRILEAIA